MRSTEFKSLLTHTHEVLKRTTKDGGQGKRAERYRPYPKQIDFHDAGAAHRERLFLAGNQLGKTLAGAFEEAAHATGRYPIWWRGRRFAGPTVSWVAGVTGESTRDTVQRALLGERGRGGGALRQRQIVSRIMARSIPGLIDTLGVKHVSGGVSTIAFKSYEKGREKWQGATLDRVWFDEEPPHDIYSEGLTRTNATGGLVWLTMTPLLGMSEVVRSFLDNPTPDRHVTQMTIDDAFHYTDADRARIVAAYLPHEREARAKGIPALGSGRIFPIEEAAIAVDSFDIPRHWPQIGGIDFGWDHPTAAVRLALDRDADCVYVTHAYANALSSALADTAGNLAYQNYTNERGNMLRADALAPTLANQDYTDIGQLASAGDAQRQLAQQGINASVDRYNYNQNLPYNALANYMRMIQGNYGSSSTQTSQSYANPIAGALGLGKSSFDPYAMIGNIATIASLF